MPHMPNLEVVLSKEDWKNQEVQEEARQLSSLMWIGYAFEHTYTDTSFIQNTTIALAQISCDLYGKGCNLCFK